ncbi:MAG TPA: hypothetical protein PKH97_10095 [Tetrasphaera sp.]|uniref:hypothetical protein n=1 Tax=Nostocoides sp. TaxID=1917966 RepID=UPI002BF60E65|nr:hypothetical protein [Tetrasphaera sp.]HNQ07523.1 hypothetical protein [Tetrasphaera sp.]
MSTESSAGRLPTAPIVAAGLAGGYVVASSTGIRPLGGLVLGAAGLLAGRTWLMRHGPTTAGLLGGVYLLAFGASHPLAKQIGAWPAVAVVSAVSAAAAYFGSDRSAR